MEQGLNGTTTVVKALVAKRDTLRKQLEAIEGAIDALTGSRFNGRRVWMQDSTKVKAWKRHIARGVRRAARIRRAAAAQQI